MSDYTGLWHHWTHKHTFMRKDGVGDLIYCKWRTSRKISRMIFAPDVPEGEEPKWKWVPPSKVEDLFACETPEQAWAVLGKE